MGSGIGSGIISKGKLHRGAQGCAGDIGHIAVAEPTNIICRCGNVGCLEAIAGGVALARDANEAAVNSLSPYLQQQLEDNGSVTGRDVTQGALRGDNWCVEAITAAARQVGKILATLVNFHNPSVIVIGGGLSSAGNLLLASIRQTVYSRSLPLATRDLEIRLGDNSDSSGLRGAAEMILSELFSPFILTGVRGLGQYSAATTCCPEGHEYTGANLYVKPSGSRVCRICVSASGDRYRARRRALKSQTVSSE